ncbi:MAG: Co2+/Mg2+ efflux protein ApaG [Hyphomicrobiales bacterium]|nr:MAG: Co2+/Mg2+ efflux protein ApaG [Hyphomicrobiales bacterium]
MTHDYQTVTNGIIVTVVPRFMEQQSDPDSGHYVWSYSVEIVNNGEDIVQLESRFWSIIDATGYKQTVEGSGVVGEQPVLNPGDSYSYVSGCPLGTSSGMMAGHFIMRSTSNHTFKAQIPAFSLDSPYEKAVFN